MANVRRRARELVSQLQMPEPWSIDDVCVQVGVLRGRDVLLERIDSPRADTPTASVRRESHRDVIAYRSDHQNPDHLIAHEIGHLLAGHLDGPTDLRDVVDPDMRAAVLRMNRDCAYDSAEERIAEAVADELMSLGRSHTRSREVRAEAVVTLRGFGEAMR